jgi:LysR family transcriptional regulator, glycine cleavage system transcriptional activator
LQASNRTVTSLDRPALTAYYRVYAKASDSEASMRGCYRSRDGSSESRIATRKSFEGRRARRGPTQAAVKPLRRLPLGSLRVFVSVAQHLNFTRAADALGVTASAASLQIRALEEYLARALFRRNGREVHLTKEGASLLPRVQHALAELERAVDDVRLDRFAGPLRVTTLTSFLQLWLLPRIARFRAAHPEIDLHIHTSVDSVDFVQEDFHLAIRLGRGDWPNLKSEKVLDEWLVPVCSPALYAKHGPLRTADDLKRYPLVHSVSEPWTAWLFEGRADRYAGEFRGSVFEDSQAVAQMAVHGAGLALARWSLVADDIHCGTLVAAGRPVQFARSYWLVCPNRAEGLQSVKAFTDWMRAEAKLFTSTRILRFEESSQH